jgi:hypothetical protein
MQGKMHGLVGLTVLLAAAATPAAAMDQSAIEETNCLMACDANQENCGATGHASASKHRLPAPGASGEARRSRSLRPAANFSQMEPGALAKERLR